MIVTELKQRRIPDAVSLASSVILLLIFWLTFPEKILPGILGGLLGTASLYLISRFSAMGLGDVKFAFSAGIIAGWRFIYPSLFIASAFALLVFLPLRLSKKISADYKIPFGPFILAGGICGYVLSVLLPADPLVDLLP